MRHPAKNAAHVKQRVSRGARGSELAELRCQLWVPKTKSVSLIELPTSWVGLHLGPECINLTLQPTESAPVLAATRQPENSKRCVCRQTSLRNHAVRTGQQSNAHFPL